MPSKAKPQPRQVAVSEFKAKCLDLLDQVNKTHAPLRITRRGKPLADVVPPAPEADDRDWIGSMAGTVEFVGDVISPVIDVSEIEALKE